MHHVTYLFRFLKTFPAGIYLFGINNGSISFCEIWMKYVKYAWKPTCEICSMSPIIAPEQREWHFPVVFVLNFTGVFRTQSNIYVKAFLKIVNSRNRSSLTLFFKIGALKYFATFAGKHLCWSNFIKKRVQTSILKFKISTLYKKPGGLCQKPKCLTGF